LPQVQTCCGQDAAIDDSQDANVCGEPDPKQFERLAVPVLVRDRLDAIYFNRLGPVGLRL